MKFRLLGPVEVAAEDGPVALGGPKPRAVLAVLLLNANQPVSTERLAVALWGEDAPAGAAKTVQVHVSRLRKALPRRRRRDDDAGRLQLNVQPGELDVDRFERFVDDGPPSACGRPTRPGGAALREALAAVARARRSPIWRSSRSRQPEISRLEEQRLAALETRVDADLARRPPRRARRRAAAAGCTRTRAASGSPRS